MTSLDMKTLVISESDSARKGIKVGGERVNPYDELQQTAHDKELVRVSSEGGGPTAVREYRPTYRAELAVHGYLVRQTLGHGSYSKVKLGLDVNCMCNRVAVKIVDRHKAPRDYLEKFLPRELNIWSRLEHANIVRLIEWFEDSRRVYMIIDYIECGDALKYIQARGALPEEVARTWITQVAEVLLYLHDQDIVHRDIKLENLIIDATGNLKVTDFGFVKDDSSRELSRTFCGSKSYASPEILLGQPYDPKKGDVWALAVVLYIFITGKMPFDESQGTKKILKEQRLLSNNGRTIRNASPFCRSLLLDMFIWDYADRPGIREAFDHPWFRQPTVVGDGGDSIPVAAGSSSRGSPPPRSISPPSHQRAYQHHSHH